MAIVKIRLSELKHTNLLSSLDSVQNTLKSTSFRDSAFCQHIGTSQYNQYTALLSAKPGQLFGVSLMDIFDKDIMPLPILVGLS